MADFQVYPFRWVKVRFSPSGSPSTQVEWELDPAFHDPEPYSFQLLVSSDSPTGTFTPVGPPVVNTFVAFDPQQRLYGKFLETYYKLRLTTPRGTYESAPASAYSGTNFRDWRIIREMYRQDLKKLKRYTGAYDARLLKRKRAGQLCPVCGDSITEEARQAKDTTCYGTGILGGYYPDVEFWVDLGNEQFTEKIDLQYAGTAKKSPQQVLCPALYFVTTEDIIVLRRSGVRLHVNQVAVVQSLRSVPIRLALTVELLPFSDVAYSIPVTW
jgi:hypothetical protein